MFFPLPDQREGDLEFVFRITSYDVIAAPVSVMTESHYRTRNDRDRTILGAYYGILLAMMMYNLFLYFSIRRTAYLYYCGYIVGLLMIQWSMDGTAMMYIYPEDNPDFDFDHGYDSVAVGIILWCLSQFTRLFLELKANHPWLDRLLQGCSAVGIAGIVFGPFVDATVMLPIILVVVCFAAGLVLWSGVRSLLSGYRPARYFVLAFAVLLVGAMAFVLYRLGVVGSSVFTKNGLLLGSAMEVVLLSTALGFYIRQLDAARASAVQEAADQKRAEEEARRELEHSRDVLVQSEKLANLGTMISSLAHEFANPIQTCQLGAGEIAEELEGLRESVHGLLDESDEAIAYKKLLDERFEKATEARQYIETATQRMHELSKALRAQSRNEREPTQRVDLNEVVEECLILVRAKILNFELVQSLGTIPAVPCNRTRIGQVITNLLSNAADALAEQRENSVESFRGRIVVKTAVEERAGASGVLLTVADNGAGVPEDIKAKIFEQFFTTKPAGIGTGLGLSMCANIVQQHGGRLTVEDSADLGGALFTVWLAAEELSEPG